MPIHTLGALPSQMEFLRSKAKFAAFVAGIGTGKSHVGRLYLLERFLMMHPNDLGLIATRDAKQLRNVVLNPFYTFLDELGIKYTPANYQTGIVEVAGRKMLATGLENYDSLRGTELSTIYVDEADFVKPEAIDVLFGRLRSPYAAKYGYPLQARFTTSPNGIGAPMHELFDINPVPNSHIIRAKTKENIFLPDGYVDSLYAKYPPKLAQQELEGMHVNLSDGKVYYSFDEDKNLYNPSKMDVWPGDVLIGLDFNVSPMTAVVGTKVGGKIVIYDEIYLEDSNTFEMADEIKSRYGNRAVRAYPDASSRARKTSATRSDLQILQDAGFMTHCRKANPAVMDRYNSVNSALHTGKLVISSKCKKLIRDLQQVSYDKNPDNLTHISDALGYLIYYHLPLRPTYKSQTIIP